MATAPLRLNLISSTKFEKALYSIATGDFDGDGKIEIATGDGDANLRIYKFERGRMIPIWHTKFAVWIDHIIVGDINHDYFDELLVVSGRKLVIFKYSEPNYEKIWEYDADAPITSVFVGDSNNNRQNELIIGSNDGTIIIYAQKDEPLNFKQVWKKKYEGDSIVRLADLDGDTLNEMIIANNNAFRVFRVIDKYPKKEVWTETFKTHIKEMLLFDLNSDKKYEIFLGLEDGNLKIFSHKDGNYFSEDKKYEFKNLVSSFAPGKIRDKDVIVAGSYDKTLRAFHESSEIFKIETYDKIYAVSLADIDHDGIDEILCASGNTLYVFKDDVFLTCQIDYPTSILADKDLTIHYYIKNNSENMIYNIDFSHLEWAPKILTLKDSPLKIPLLERFSGAELSFKFSIPSVERVVQIVFPRFKITFEMKNVQFSQTIPEISFNILPPFPTIAQQILSICEHFKNTKVPLKTLVKLASKELGPLEHDFERIVSQLIEDHFITGSISNWVLDIKDIKPYSEQAKMEKTYPEQKPLSPHMFMNALRNSVKGKKRSLITELAHNYNREPKEIEETLKKLKENFEITGILIPNEEFLYLTDQEIRSITDFIEKTPNIPLAELGQQFDLLENEVKFLIQDLINIGVLYGQIITKDNTPRFITVKSLSETLLSKIEEDGKLIILPYARNLGISADTVREAIRMLLDANKVEGTYTFNGAIFYSQRRLEQELVQIVKTSEITSIGLSSLAKDLMISKEAIMLAMTQLINNNLISGYISENTLFLKSHEEERLRDLFEKYIDALNLIHLLVIHRESGVAIFSASYTTETIEPALVSGFLQAITSFGSEISGKEGPIRLLRYKDLKISIQEGEYIRAALILKEDPSQRLLEILKHFVRFFDTNYRPHLHPFKGSVDPFKNTHSLIDDFFEITLSFPHEINEKEVFRNRNNISANELVLINMARSLGREFSLGALLEKSSKELLISQLEAFSIIYNLREKNIFYVITEERKWCPHCGSIILKSATICPHCLRDILDTFS